MKEGTAKFQQIGWRNTKRQSQVYHLWKENKLMVASQDAPKAYNSYEEIKLKEILKLKHEGGFISFYVIPSSKLYPSVVGDIKCFSPLLTSHADDACDGALSCVKIIVFLKDAHSFLLQAFMHTLILRADVFRSQLQSLQRHTCPAIFKSIKQWRLYSLQQENMPKNDNSVQGQVQG